MRRVVNDGMDVQAGAAICRGPRNVLSQLYQGVPIGITVEGANILTRTLIIYGQGALRCHPYAFQEMETATKDDLAGFDRAFFGHTNYTRFGRSLSLADLNEDGQADLIGGTEYGIDFAGGTYVFFERF